MIKFKLYFDKDAETAWLNEMCAQGWAMQSFLQDYISSRNVNPASTFIRWISGKSFSE